MGVDDESPKGAPRLTHNWRPVAHASSNARIDKARDGYVHHRLSMEDAIAHLAKIRAQHEAAMAAGKAKNAAHKPESRLTSLNKIKKEGAEHVAKGAAPKLSSGGALKVKMDKLHRKEPVHYTQSTLPNNFTV